MQDRINNPVNTKIIEQLSKHFPDFNRAYKEKGTAIEEFDTYGAVSRTLLQFLSGYDDLTRMIREVMVVVK